MPDNPVMSKKLPMIMFGEEQFEQESFGKATV
jgi:hypothetical protein